jgi:D-serine dehydratase
MANQLVGAQAVKFVLEEIGRDAAFDFYCFVDSMQLVNQLAAAARRAGLERPLQVVLEGGHVGGRTGCRRITEAMAVAAVVKANEPYLSLRGVGGFEGLLQGDTPKQSARLVEAFLDYLVTIAIACDREACFGAGPVLLTAGGSSFYDLVTRRFAAARIDRPFLVLTRGGCYLTHDSGTYADQFAELRRRTPEVDLLGPGPTAALEVWAYIQSRPEPEKAILTAGRRDLSFDTGLPRPLKWFRPSPHADRRDVRMLDPEYIVTGLNDQHCYLALPAESPLAVGDMVGLGISHPCTTFDKWQVICIVNDSYDIVSAIRTFF